MTHDNSKSKDDLDIKDDKNDQTDKVANLNVETNEQTDKLAKNDHTLNQQRKAQSLGQTVKEIKTQNKQKIQENENTVKNEIPIILEDNDENAKMKKIGLDDFVYERTLGRGAYGEVALVKKKNGQHYYAMKVIDKSFLFREKKQYQVYIEREVLMKLSSPYLIKLFYSFQDKYKLYFILEYLEGGEFSSFLAKQIELKNLSLEAIAFYTAEIVNILEFLHRNGIAHRDLKPENLMVTSKNHLKVIDFGTAQFFNTNFVDQELVEQIRKIKMQEKGEIDDPKIEDAVLGQYQKKRRATFVGTAEYVSPELLEDDECSAPADLWALGCIIYKMFTGLTPFDDVVQYNIFQKVKKGQYSCPKIIPEDAANLIDQLLVRNPQKRLGAGAPGAANDFKALKAHPFFKGIDFDNLFWQPAPIQPLEKTQVNQMTPDPINNDVSTQSQTSQKEEGSIIFSGLVQKKCGFIFYKPRKLQLQNPSRLIYYDPYSLTLKGEIILDKDAKCILNGKSKWIIQTPKRKYKFKEIEHPAYQWQDKINAAIKQSIQQNIVQQLTNPQTVKTLGNKQKSMK